MGTWTAVVGAISHAGRREAASLAARGKDLVLIAAERNALEVLAAELRVGHGVDVRICAVSLASEGAATHIVRWLRERDLSIDGIVAVLEAEPSQRSNVDALIEALLPRMRSHGFASVSRVEAGQPPPLAEPLASGTTPRARRTTAPGYGDPS